MDKKDFKRIVGEGVGEASMCWGDTPKGIFDDVRAGEIVNEIIEAAKHPTCSTCRHFEKGSCCEIGEYGRHAVRDDFYCADHEAKEEVRGDSLK